MTKPREKTREELQAEIEGGKKKIRQFENQEKMEASFPADFIAEYTGQIRAWFYVMHTIGVMVK